MTVRKIVQMSKNIFCSSEFGKTVIWP